MATTTITVPAEKAEHLLILSKISPEALKILSAKVNVDPAKLAALEKKLIAFQFMI